MFIATFLALRITPRFKPGLAVIMVLCWCAGVASAAPPPPDSGSLLQQSQPAKPPPPANNSTGLKMEQPSSSNLPASAPFMIKVLAISGNTLFDTATLHSLVADMEGHEQTLEQLNAAVDRISDFYHTHGYPLARAYVPAQTIQDGLVKIIVIEARYGEIHLNNSSLVDDETINSILGNLHPQDFVDQNRLDRTLLILSDQPGLSSSATLQPGQAVATSDLMIETVATAPFNENVQADNYGNASTGRARLSGTVNWNDPLHQGDYLSANLLTAGRNMDSASLTYETLVSGEGARMGADATALHYRLGDTLEALDGHGTAQTASLWWKYPWQRSVDVNVTTQLQIDYKNLKDDIDSTGIKTNRHLDAAQLMLSGDVEGALLAGAETTWSFVMRAGEKEFDNTAAQALDEKSARSAGGFMKFNINVNRLQNFSQDTALFAAISTQWSNGNLDSAEKMVAGGAFSVRAYDMGVLSGDSGIVNSLELRHNLGDWLDGTWQAVAFFDHQYIRINQDPWTIDTNGAHLHGPGLGLNWANQTGWHFKLFAAGPSGTVPELLKTNRSVRGWAEIGAWF